MISYTEKKVIVVNLSEVYKLVSTLTNSSIRFENWEEYGTNCYGFFSAKLVDNSIDSSFILNKLDNNEYIDVDTIFSFLINCGELPKIDLFFEVDA